MSKFRRPDPAVFLDRDGTINEEIGYLHKWKDWRWLPGVINGMARLAGAGYKLVVVSNQAGIARGYYGVEAWNEICAKMDAFLAPTGTKIAGYYCCPHHPEYNGPCSCRKPAPGMILTAAEELSLDLEQSWLIGDKDSDIKAGLAAGCRPLLVRTGHVALEMKQLPSAIPSFSDFSEAVDFILAHREETNVKSSCGAGMPRSSVRFLS